MDFKKAFDSVLHAELLLKLWRLGVTGPLWYWFQAYLTNRQHYVSINGASSTLLYTSVVRCATGMYLRSLTIFLYINDLPEQIDYALCYFFANNRNQ